MTPLDSQPAANRVDHKQLNWALGFAVLALMVYGGSRRDSGWVAVLEVGLVVLEILFSAYHLLLAFAPVLFPEVFSPSDE